MRAVWWSGLLGMLVGCGGRQVTPGVVHVPSGEDAMVTEADFDCLKAWPQVGGVRVRSVSGHHAEAELAVEAGGPFPVGTILQLFPEEAMVKRGQGFSPATNDWEFLVLSNAHGETRIEARGTTEVRNVAGTCAGCHAEAEPRYDMVCRTGRGCKPLPGIALRLAERSLQRDSRCP